MEKNLMLPINHNVSDDVSDLFEELCANLGPPKYKVLEACVLTFSALPKEAQYILKAQNEEDRKEVLSRLRAMSLKSEKGKRA